MGPGLEVRWRKSTKLRKRMGSRLRELASAARGGITQPRARCFAELCTFHRKDEENMLLMRILERQTEPFGCGESLLPSLSFIRLSRGNWGIWRLTRCGEERTMIASSSSFSWRTSGILHSSESILQIFLGFCSTFQFQQIWTTDRDLPKLLLRRHPCSKARQ